MTARVALIATVLLIALAAPADAAGRYWANGCAKGSSAGRVQYTYLHSIPLPSGERICRYQTMRRLPWLGWWPSGSVSKWART